MIRALTQRYRQAPPATFRLIVNPMVTWIWVGGLVVLAGALVTLWPSPPRPGAGSRASARRAWAASSPGLSASRRKHGRVLPRGTELVEEEEAAYPSGMRPTEDDERRRSAAGRTRRAGGERWRTRSSSSC